MTHIKHGNANYLQQGSWNVICDRCGRKYKRENIRLEWTGLLVCFQCFDPRHPYTLPLPIVLDGLGVPMSRPRQEPAAILELSENTGVIGFYYMLPTGQRVTDLLLGSGNFVLGGLPIDDDYTSEFFPT